MSNHKKITVIGAGPGGLYFSILTKKRWPEVEINIYEQNKADDAFGFGVVFSDETLSEFLSYDEGSYELIRNSFAYWDNLDIVRDGQKVRIKGNGFCGCSRKTLLQLLQRRCREEGVNLYFEHRIDDLSPFANSHIILASDGIGSSIRTANEKAFGTNITMKSNRFLWCGSTRPLDAFTYFFKSTPYGAFCAHTYQYEEGHSTWIFECSNETFLKAGFEVFNEKDSIEKLENLFKDVLDGHALISNKSHWRQFPHVENAKWSHDNIVLLGDAKATAHYSIGSGTKLAMDCAIALSNAVVNHKDNIQEAFKEYEETRRTPVGMIQHAALVSLDWFEAIDRHFKQDFETFAFSVMSRSKKITIANQARRDSKYAQSVIHHFNTLNKNSNLNTPPALSPYKLGHLNLQNRIVMSAMGQYCSHKGVPSKWDKIHFTSRAIGNVGLIITGMTAISPTARITDKCNGIYNKKQIAAWKSINDFIHKNTQTKTAIQLGHSGRKGSVKADNLGIFEKQAGWKLISASPIPYKDGFDIPKEMCRKQMLKIKKQFVKAAKNAISAGFDAIELQMHNGFLLASFLSPLTNTRKDEYGGSIENRAKYPLEVFKAIKEAVGNDYPVIAKVSVTDWHPDGISKNDALYVCNMLKKMGVTMINVNTGNTVVGQKPMTGRMWQTPFAEWIRNTVDIPTMTSGNIEDIDQANTVILNARTDLVALGRPLLAKPYWVWEAMAHEQFEADNLDALNIPLPYKNGIIALYSKMKKDRIEFEDMKLRLKPISHQKNNS